MNVLGSCSATNEQRKLEANSLHLLGHMNHLVQRRCDQAGQTNYVWWEEWKEGKTKPGCPLG